MNNNKTLLNLEYWKKFNSCKKQINYQDNYWVCNVSSCNKKRTGLVFCSVSCWDAHIPLMNHRESWALEMCSPSMETYKLELEECSNRRANQKPLRTSSQDGDHTINQMNNKNQKNEINSATKSKANLIILRRQK